MSINWGIPVFQAASDAGLRLLHHAGKGWDLPSVGLRLRRAMFLRRLPGTVKSRLPYYAHLIDRNGAQATMAVLSYGQRFMLVVALWMM